jgi:hypothetical protein
VSTPMAPAPYGSPAAFRPPGQNECELCGSHPAARKTFQSVTSIAILYIITTNRGTYCRTCGLALFRERTNRSLMAGWWGVGVIAIPILGLFNWLRLRTLLQLAPPQPTPGVSAQLRAPLDPGKTVLQRPGAIVTAVLLVLLIAFIAFGIWASSGPPIE